MECPHPGDHALLLWPQALVKKRAVEPRRATAEGEQPEVPITLGNDRMAATEEIGDPHPTVRGEPAWVGKAYPDRYYQEERNQHDPCAPQCIGEVEPGDGVTCRQAPVGQCLDHEDGQVE